MGELGIDVKLLIGQVINFLILLFLLTYFAYKPIVKMLNDRREKIAEGLENAKKIKEDLANTEKRVAEIIDGAEKKSAKIIEESTKAANQQKEEIVALAKNQADKEIEKAKIAINQEKDAAKKSLEKDIIDLVGLATEKILKEKVSPEMQKSALDEATIEYEKK
jgi:F-type H+-transporting ATPase subunit b